VARTRAAQGKAGAAQSGVHAQSAARDGQAEQGAHVKVADQGAHDYADKANDCSSHAPADAPAHRGGAALQRLHSHDALGPRLSSARASVQQLGLAYGDVDVAAPAGCYEWTGADNTYVGAGTDYVNNGDCVSGDDGRASSVNSCNGNSYWATSAR
jgi:hypothetical protein